MSDTQTITCSLHFEPDGQIGETEFAFMSSVKPHFLAAVAIDMLALADKRAAECGCGPCCSLQVRLQTIRRTSQSALRVLRVTQ